MADELPRPVFDHVIARCPRIDGREVWVDPDSIPTSDGAPLGSVPVGYGRALVAARDTTDLSILDEANPTEPTAAIKELFRLKGDTATLDVTSTYRGSHANTMRYRLGTGARAKLKSGALEFYTKQFGEAEATAEVVIDDDVAKNVIVVREAYKLPKAVKEGATLLFAHELSRDVSAPAVTHRSSPLSVPHPLFIRHEIEFESKDRKVGIPEDKLAGDAALSFTMQSRREPGHVRVVYELKSLADSVSVADLPRHLEALSKIRDAIDQTVSVTDATARSQGDVADADETGKVLVIVFDSVVALVLLTIGVALYGPRVLAFIRRRRSIRRARPATGQAPAKAIRVRTREDAERHVLEQRWECGHKGAAGSGDLSWGSILLNGQSVAALRAECPTCGDIRIRYFIVGDGVATEPRETRKAG